MAARSKFTEETRQKILQALSVGASRRTAAAIAGINEAQIRRWLKQGETATRGSRFREFYDAVNEAEAAPRVRALGIIYREMPDNPALAWKFIERREPGFAPPVSAPAAAPAPQVIVLTLDDGRPLPELPRAVMNEAEPEAG